MTFGGRSPGRAGWIWLALGLLTGCNAILGLEPLPGEPNDVGASGSTGVAGGSAAGTTSGSTAAGGGTVQNSMLPGSGSTNGGATASFAGTTMAGGTAGAAGGGEPTSSAAFGGSGGGGSGGGDAGGAGAGGTGAGGSSGSGGTGSGGSGGNVCPAPLDFMPKTLPSPLTNTCWKTSASDCAQIWNRENAPENALDGNLETRFSTGEYMEPGTAFEFEIDLRSIVNVGRVVLTSHLNDWARELSVYVSLDGKVYKPVACGPGALVTDFWFNSTKAQYVKFVQGGTGPGWWSLHEVAVYGDGADTCTG